MNKNPTDATVRRNLFTAKLFYMFRVSQHSPSGVSKTVPAASGTGHTTCIAAPLQLGLIGTDTPDDGCCDTRNMYSSSAVNKYLHTVASVGFLFTLNTHSCFETSDPYHPTTRCENSGLLGCDAVLLG